MYTVFEKYFKMMYTSLKSLGPPLAQKGHIFVRTRNISLCVIIAYVNNVVLYGGISAHSSSNTFRTPKHKYLVTIKSASKYSLSL